MPDSIVVLGLGHAVSLIAEARWLAVRDVYYWSDLDTHGFAMLDHLRASFPGARSLLMDRATLEAHRPLWTAEEAPHVAPLDRLTPEEAGLCADLRYDASAAPCARSRSASLSLARLRPRRPLIGRILRRGGGLEGPWRSFFCRRVATKRPIS